MKLVPVAYLASYLLSLLGNSIAGIALPLIVLQVTGSALGAGAVAAATAIPAVLAGLVMGVVIDRINRRTSSIVTDLVSAASVAALPLIDLISGLSLGWFILFGIIGSLGDVPGMTERDALLPAIVRHGGIASERLIGIREALGAVALLLGPAAAGTLMVLFDGSTVLWIIAVASLTAALLTLLIPHRVGAIVTTDGAAAATSGSGWAQLRDGWRVLFRSPFLVVTTTLSLTSVIVHASLQGLILPVYFTLVEQPGMLGFMLTALAAGCSSAARSTPSSAHAGGGESGSSSGWSAARSGSGSSPPYRRCGSCSPERSSSDSPADCSERAAAALTRQAAEQQAERDRQEQAVAAADAHAVEVRAEVAAPLIEQASADGTAYLSARDRAWEAHRDRDRAGLFRRRAAARAMQDADGALRATEDAAGKQADTDPQVIQARQDAEHAHRAQQQLTKAHLGARADLRRRIYGDQRPVDPVQRAAGWRSRAEQDRRDLAQVEALPVDQAAQLVRDRAAQAEMERIAAEQVKAAAKARAAKLARFPSPSSEHRRSGPERDFGPRL